MKRTPSQEPTIEKATNTDLQREQLRRAIIRTENSLFAAQDAVIALAVKLHGQRTELGKYEERPA